MFLCSLDTNSGSVKLPSPVNDDPTVTLTNSAGQASLDQLLGQREAKPGGHEPATAVSPSRKACLREIEASANLRLSDLERVAVIGQGGFGRVELVS